MSYAVNDGLKKPQVGQERTGNTVLYTEPKPQYYWDKVTKVLSENDNTAMTKIQVDFS